MVKDDPTIGLYGILGVYNYGCEAIIRGTEIILHKKWPDAHIKYASLRPEDDKQRLKGCDVEIIPRKMHRFGSMHRFNGLMAVQTGFYSKKLFQENLKWIESCDVIFSVGGDFYTIPPYIKDSKFLRHYNSIIHFGEIVKAKGKPFVIWGASIGPFESGTKTKNIYANHLSKVDLITSREPKTSLYLKEELGIYQNVQNCADPAFIIPFTENHFKDSKKTIIGINLSPMSSFYVFGENFNDTIKYQSKLITKLVKKFDAKIILIPHVVCYFDYKDDDLRYLKNIWEQLPSNISKNVTLLDKDLGFIGTKKILSECDIVLASRMHCVINALTVGTPTILISYSQKAAGMAEYVYGTDKWVISLNEMMKNPDKLFRLMKLILLEKEDLNKFIKMRMINIKKDVYNPITAIEKLLQNG